MHNQEFDDFPFYFDFVSEDILQILHQIPFHIIVNMSQSYRKKLKNLYFYTCK